MARQEINIFGTSFLDLLSGALAAVIILFVIVPKMTRENADLLHKVEEIQVIAVDVGDLLDKIKNTVSQEVLESLKDEMNDLKSKMGELQHKLEELEDEVRQASDERDRWKDIAEKQREKLEELQVRLAAAEIQAKEAEEKSRTANTVEKTLGVFAQFGILCKWSETETDVDMGVQRFGVRPEQCWRMYPSKKWGILGEDVRERSAREKERFELFYVPQIYADEYTFWVNVFEQSAGVAANISCVLIFHPGKPDEEKKEIGPVYVTKGRIKCVASFRLSESGLELIGHREPVWGNGKVIK